MSPPFDLLTHLYGDEVISETFSGPATVRCWLRVEGELARAQADCGVIPADDASTIAAAAETLSPDLDALWRDTRVVGYPILPLVRQLAAAIPAPASGRVHYGATTQDIMDTGLVLQIAAAADRVRALVTRFGDALDNLVGLHAGTVMAARTHAQQAVPTTYGAKLAVYLDALTRHDAQLRVAADRARVVSLAGAGGTAAALGPRATEIRQALAARLGLRATAVPWHVARDRLTTVGLCGVQAATTAARFAQEIIDLSRTEIGEVQEAGGHGRGASSTMPQKANPITSEAIIGLAANAQALAGAQLRAAETGHERAAGQWQIEWYALPHLLLLAGSALRLAGELADGLRVHPAAMARNLAADGGLNLAEAAMFVLAPALGRDAAHELVYRAAAQTRTTGRPLPQTLAALLPPTLRDTTGAALAELAPGSYLGEAELICAAARRGWHDRAEDP